MDDTAILNTLQALVEEHARHTGMGMDIVVGDSCFTIPPPSIVLQQDFGRIATKEAPDVRALLTKHLQSHILRLATAKLLDQPTQPKFR